MPNPLDPSVGRSLSEIYHGEEDKGLGQALRPSKPIHQGPPNKPISDAGGCLGGSPITADPKNGFIGVFQSTLQDDLGNLLMFTVSHGNTYAYRWNGGAWKPCPVNDWPETPKECINECEPCRDGCAVEQVCPTDVDIEKLQAGLDAHFGRPPRNTIVNCGSSPIEVHRDGYTIYLGCGGAVELPC